MASHIAYDQNGNPIDTTFHAAQAAAANGGSSSASGGNVKFGFFSDDSNSNQFWNGIDFFLPFSTALTNAFDLNGRRAAAAQASAQFALDNAARAFSANEAQKQRDWEKMMSDTAIQRQMEDYKKAGLNPWLAINHGSFGAAVPSGSSAQSNAGQANKADNKLAMAAGLIATALRIFLMKH